MAATFNIKDMFGSLQEIGSSNVSINSRSPSYTRGASGSKLTIPFNSRLNKENKELIRKLFQSNACNQETHAISNLSVRLTTVEEIVKEFVPDFTTLLEEPGLELGDCISKSNKEKLLKVAITLSKHVFDRVFFIVSANRELVIRDGQLEANVDKAEYLLIETFNDVTRKYIDQGKLKRAYDAALNIRYSKQGAIAFLLMSKSCLLFNENQESAIACLNKVHFTESVRSNLNTFIDEIKENLGVDALKELVRKLDNTRLASTIIANLSEMYLKNDDIDNCISVIMMIKKSYNQGKELEKVIDHLIDRRDLCTAVSVIKSLDNEYNQQQKYNKIIEIYISNHKIDEALELTRRNVNSSYKQKQIYSKVVDYYLENGKLSKAKEVVELFDSDYEKNKQKAKFFKYL